MPNRLIVPCFVGALTACAAYAQPAKAPHTYSAIVVDSTMGAPMTMKVDRDGSNAVVDKTLPNTPPIHRRTYYDLQKHQSRTMDVNSPEAGCNSANFSGDWGDPFEMSAAFMKDLAGDNPRQTGTESLNGFATKVLEAGAAGPQHIKVWLDSTYGLVVKAQMGPQTLMEIKQLSLAKPAAAILALPVACAAAPPPPPTEGQRFAAETGGNAADFANAIMPPPSPDSCSVLLRAVQAGSMQPIAGGWQVAIDTTVDPNHMPSYSMGESANGHATFSGGGLHEVTAQMRNGELRIDNAPPQFDVEAYFGRGGSASALIYRHCVSPRTVLLLVVKNPAKLSDGADWLWVKSGRFAAGN
jgi:hypothetical protein